MGETVTVFLSYLDYNGVGDFVRCNDCGALQLVEECAVQCHHCGSTNIQWADANCTTGTAEDLYYLGYNTQDDYSA